jgi:methylase of polypeptide subunit release factors
MPTKLRKTREVAEFGDFQTPLELAVAAMHRLRALGVQPHAIIEPTCGTGAFVEAAAIAFPDAQVVVGIDINGEHLEVAKRRVALLRCPAELIQGDFFQVRWQHIVTNERAPWLIVGNPPWVTSADLGTLQSPNLPQKSNFQGRTGIEAITGKSNFDISEWMLLRYLDWIEGSDGTIAVLCKTSVARKLLRHIWEKGLTLKAANIFKIDALGHFGAAVDACFFVLQRGTQARAASCSVFDSLESETPSHVLGFVDGHVVSDLAAFNTYRELAGAEPHYLWRSGVKHDCSKVMELAKTATGYQNAFGETVVLEEAIAFPMLKSSDIGNGRLACRSVMLVPQERVGQDTAYLKSMAPLTWEYLTRHTALLEKRGSSIYRNRPPFSIFGVGPYTFAPWKVAISGFYKSLRFVKVGPVGNRPVVFDDTIYFVPCWSEEEADFLETVLSSEVTTTFYRSLIHWDEKRPITAEILRRLNIGRVAALLGLGDEYERFSQGPRHVKNPSDAAVLVDPATVAR